MTSPSWRRRERLCAWGDAAIDNSEEKSATLAEQAARWLFEMQDPGPSTLVELAAWLKASPAHVEEFLLVTAAWTALDALQ